GGAALAATGLVATARPARADYKLAWNAWGPLDGYGVNAECNPGGGSLACGPSDVEIKQLSGWSEVTANPSGRVTYVNAIGNRKFLNSTPDTVPLRLTRYQYLYAIRLPRVPTRT